MDSREKEKCKTEDQMHEVLKEANNFEIKICAS